MSQRGPAYSVTMTSMQVTVYVRQDDEELWRWAQAWAHAHRMAVSAVVMTALEAFRDAQQSVTKGT